MSKLEIKKQTIKSAHFNGEKLFINNKEVVEDFGEWMYRLRIITESLSTNNIKL